MERPIGGGMTRVWRPEEVGEAAAALRAGGLVAFPTETVYGLGARADDAAAVARIYAAKGRPRFNPLISHVSSLKAAEALVELPPAGRRLAEAFWPGALTLVAPRRGGGGISDLACAGLASAAVRVPAHPLARALLVEVGAPVAAPSANRSGRVSPTTAAHVVEELGEALGGASGGVLDGGACPVGVESTIVGFEGAEAVLLRPGGVPREAVEGLLGRLLGTVAEGSAPVAPGQLASHYAPGAALRLDAAAPEAGEGWLDFGARARAAGPALDLSPSGDLEEAAANLFAHLRALDAALGGGGRIAVAPIPERGLGAAIRDRLSRAAAPRVNPDG